ncbi:hypothetical protein DPX16_0944 [Anabarilius grahami]|uniref:Uncharacterized protein n=1 Tax=Anabarilius grahami TaxID=495550 RepID=A0A3N0XL35_ANAGA|nr:hypothetical protein DPX16_0944 [Anabarilius grahami]
MVGMPEGAEGSDVASFLRANLSKWIPSLNRDFEMDWAHRMYDGMKNTDRPRTIIFRVLRWHDRSGSSTGSASDALDTNPTTSNVSQEKQGNIMLTLEHPNQNTNTNA